MCVSVENSKAQSVFGTLKKGIFVDTIFYFFLLEEGKGESEAPGRAGFVFIENPRRGGGFARGGGGGRGGRGGWRVSVGDFFVGGRGLDIFFRGRNSHQAIYCGKFWCGLSAERIRRENLHVCFCPLTMPLQFRDRLLPSLTCLVHKTSSHGIWIAGTMLYQFGDLGKTSAKTSRDIVGAPKPKHQHKLWKIFTDSFSRVETQKSRKIRRTLLKTPFSEPGRLVVHSDSNPHVVPCQIWKPICQTYNVTKTFRVTKVFIRCQIPWPFFSWELCRKAPIVGANLKGAVRISTENGGNFAENWALIDAISGLMADFLRVIDANAGGLWQK